MLFGITGFEVRYQLRNPVFWVAIAIFFLMGFGLTASENVSIGTPGGVHENAPNAIAIATAVFSLFYVFVITAFVANAIIRDDASGFAPIVRTTTAKAHQIVIGRFVGGLIIAWLGYLALPVGMWAGSIMPWVDPERIGPQVFSYYSWPFLVFAIPNIFLLCAVLFALATLLRSMMAAYVGAIALVMGYLITNSVVGQKIEYREAAAKWEPLGTGALQEATRYWTQSELNGRLIDLSGDFPVGLRDSRPSYRRGDGHGGERRLGAVPDHDRGLLRRRARVARTGPQGQRADRFHGGAELGHDRPQDHRDLPHPAARQPVGGADRRGL